jgi:hypothetical protein
LKKAGKSMCIEIEFQKAQVEQTSDVPAVADQELLRDLQPAQRLDCYTSGLTERCRE